MTFSLNLLSNSASFWKLSSYFDSFLNKSTCTLTKQNTLLSPLAPLEPHYILAGDINLEISRPIHWNFQINIQTSKFQNFNLILSILLKFDYFGGKKLLFILHHFLLWNCSQLKIWKCFYSSFYQHFWKIIKCLPKVVSFSKGMKMYLIWEENSPCKIQ